MPEQIDFAFRNAVDAELNTISEFVRMNSVLESTDAKNKLEDLSGVKIQPGENPYKALIAACNDDQVCYKAFTLGKVCLGWNYSCEKASTVWIIRTKQNSRGEAANVTHKMACLAVAILYAIASHAAGFLV